MLGRIQHGFDEGALAAGVEFPVAAGFRGEPSFQRLILRGVVRSFPQSVPEEEAGRMGGIAFSAEVEPRTIGTRCRRKRPEAACVRVTVKDEACVAEAGAERRQRPQVRYHRVDIDLRLRGQSGYRRAADVVDRADEGREQGGDGKRPLLEERRPKRIIFDQRDARHANRFR